MFVYFERWYGIEGGSRVGTGVQFNSAFDKRKLESLKVESNARFRRGTMGKLTASDCGNTIGMRDHNGATVAITEDDRGEGDDM
jgi:hypothetical protein